MRAHADAEGGGRGKSGVGGGRNCVGFRKWMVCGCDMDPGAPECSGLTEVPSTSSASVAASFA